MDSGPDFSSSFSFIREEANITSAGVAVNPDVALGLLLAYSSLGLATIIGAFVYHRGQLDSFKRTLIMGCSGRHRHIIGVQNVQISLLPLLGADVLSFAAAMVLVSELASSCTTGYNCVSTYVVWFMLTWLEILFQLLCALVCLLYLSASQSQQPQQGPRLRTLMGMFSLLCVVIGFLFVLVSHVGVYLLGATNIVLTLSVVAKYFRSPASSSFPTVRKLVTAAAMCTFFIVFLPSFILACLRMNANTFEESTKYEGILGIVAFSTNCLLTIDGLVCFLILKLSAAEEEQQRQQLQWHQQPQQQPQQQQQQQSPEGCCLLFGLCINQPTRSSDRAQTSTEP